MKDNEIRKYAVLTDDGIKLVPLNKYIPAVLRGIDSTQKRGKFDPVLNENTIIDHFQYIRESCVAIGATEEDKDIGEIQQDVVRWFKIENPVEVLVRDLIEGECSQVTINHYRDAANRYMRFVGYEPTFTHEELFAFINSLNGVSASTRQWNRAVLKCWWESMNLIWPIRKRRMHKPHEEAEPDIPSFKREQIFKAIRLAKSLGTPEIRYYFALVTVFAPRRVELCRITQKNFTWDIGSIGTGVLKFNPHKHGLTRIHQIPKELVPYLKYDATPMPEWLISKRFHEWCRHIKFDTPTPEKGKRGSWHAFRHGVTTALLESRVDSVILQRWMGWRTGAKETAMVSRYYSPEERDSIVYSAHPFIEAWSE